jgi:hypothetical protein
MALRDDDKVMAGLLRRTLASSPTSGAAPSADDCPPANILAAYYEHSLDAVESVRYELHFSQCALCREQLAAMARADEASQPQPKASWAWLWNPYWLAPALAVLALAIFFGVRHSTRITATATTGQPANAPLAAMSRPDQAPQQAPAAPPPLAAAGTAPSNELKKAPLDSAARDSLAKEKQSQLRESPATSTGPLADSEPSASPAAPAVSDKKAQDAPLKSRDFIQLQSLRKSETVQKDAGAPQGFAQSAGAVVAGARVQSAQNTAPSRQAPAPTVLGGVAGTGAATASGDNLTAESVNRNQTQAPAAMSRFAGIAKSPAPQVAAETPAQKIFQTPNTTVLWRSADGGFVERSPDGGATWEGEPLPGTSGEIDAGSSPTPKICWLVGSGGTIFMTKDAANWKKITPPVQSDFSAVTAKDASNATVTAADGRQFQTTDAGKHWKAVP